MIRVNIYIISIFLLITTSISLACYFDTGWTTFTQPNGNKFIARMYGDEYESRFETQDGFSLEKNFKDGYYYYASGSNSGRFELTGLKVGIDQPVRIPENLVKINPFRSRSTKNNTNNDPVGNNILAKTATTTTYTIKVLLVEFQDVHGIRVDGPSYTRTNFTNMLAGSNYTMSPDGETTFGSVNQYYQSMANGKITIQATVLNSAYGDTPIWVRLPHTKNYYYKDSTDFMPAAHAAGVAAGYDMSSGTTTKIAFIYAGDYYGDGLNPQELGNQYMMFEVWAGSPYFNIEGTVAQGFTFAHIGTHCHEFGHLLGLLDIYGWDGSGLELNWSLYGNGDKLGPTNPYKGQCPAPIDPYQRDHMNWITVQTPTIPNTGVNLVYNGSNPTIYKITSGTTSYYFENRRYQDFGSYCPDYASYQGSGGILVWRADPSYICLTELIVADNQVTKFGKFGDLWPGSSGNRYLNDFTTPNCLTFNGTNSNIIMHSVSDPGTTMTAILGGSWFGNLPTTTTWSGTISVGGNLTIPSGLALTVNNGSTINSTNGAQLIVNGTLTANGNSASTPILFNFTSPNSTLNNGIVFNSSSSGTINYCQIRNADRGIYENYGMVNISNSAFSGCNSGIYLYHSSPTIQLCNIHDNINYGIYLTYSSPYLYNNYIQNNTYGVDCSTSSSPTIGNVNGTGNRIKDNTKGVYCANNSLPILGTSTTSGFNNLTTSSYNVYNISSGTVNAMNNWWGPGNPPNYSNLGGVNTNNPYINQNPLSISPQPPLSKSSANNLLASTGSDIPFLDQLNQINELIAVKNLVQARNICMNLITNYPNYSVSYNALNLLKDTYDAKDITNIINIYASLFNSKVKNNINAMAGLILSEIDKENRLSRIEDVINNYQGQSIVELALYDNFVFYYFEKQDKPNAITVSKQLDQLFPLSWGAIEAHRVLGDMEFFKVSATNEQALQKTTNQSPTEFALIGNFPNPFNPTTKINYQIPVNGFVTLKIYDILGREVASLVNENEQAGNYSVAFDASKLSSGIYIYTIHANNFTQSKKMIVMK